MLKLISNYKNTKAFFRKEYNYRKLKAIPSISFRIKFLCQLVSKSLEIALFYVCKVGATIQFYQEFEFEKRFREFLRTL